MTVEEALDELGRLHGERTAQVIGTLMLGIVNDAIADVDELGGALERQQAQIDALYAHLRLQDPACWSRLEMLESKVDSIGSNH